FMVLLLVVQCLSAISPESRDPVSASRSKTEFRGARMPQKGSLAKRTGHTLRVAAQYSQKSPKNNGLFRAWLAEFGLRVRLGPLWELVRGIDPAQHFLEVVFHRIIAKTGARLQCLTVAHQN